MRTRNPARRTRAAEPGTPSNIARLVATVEPFHPYLRGPPAGLPFRLDENAVRRGLNFTLERSIATRRAAGRPRDQDALAELEALLEERDARR